jgi:hypothetical protein
MVGYTLVKVAIPVLLPAADNSGSGRELFRYTTSWVSDGGSTRIEQPSTYLYLTSDRLKLTGAGGTEELLPGGGHTLVCPSLSGAGGNPFGPAAQSSAWCWSRANGTAGAFVSREPAHRAFATVNWSIPMLIAAVDPVAEARLDGLDHAVTSGGYLAQASGAGSGTGQTSIPVLAAATSGVGESAETTVERLPSPSSAMKLSVAGMTGEDSVPGKRLETVRTTAEQAYATVVRAMRGPGNGEPIRQLYTAGPTQYLRNAAGSLIPQRVSNPASVWQPSQATTSLLATPMDNADVQYRKLRQEPEGGQSAPQLQVVGLFDPNKIQAFDPLSQVPLGAYEPTKATAADAASRRALHGSALTPSLNLGGYVSQPVDLVTSMSGLSTLENAGYGQNADAPISVIRVRVNGVTGPNALSLARMREVAQQIEQRTHLDVDIVAGSSPEPTAIGLPAGKYGQPPLALTENWVKKGVAVSILTAVDRNSVALFVLILVVCVLFVANSATAAVRSRRRELGILASLGWTRPRLFLSVVGELAVVGLAAGIVGAIGARLLAPAIGLHASTERAVLAVPVGIGVAVLAGVVPAWFAAHTQPIVSVRPPVMAVRRAHHPGGITSLAAINLVRTPGRVIVAALSLALGTVAFTVLAAVSFAFHGVLVGSLLGNAVAVQVRSVDYIAAIATIIVGVVAVADVIVLNIRERAPELSAIRSFGWRESALGRLVVTEGAIIGLLGAVLGAAIGLYLAGRVGGHVPGGLYVIAVFEVVVGVFVTAAASLVPAQALRRLPTARLLAEE